MTTYIDHRGQPRIVVTGIGIISPIGNDLETNWDNLLAGRSGIDRVTRFNAEHLPCQIAGEIKGFNPRDYIPHKEIRRMARSSHLAVAAATEALAHAGYEGKVPDPERTGVLVGTGFGGFDFAVDHYDHYRKNGLGRSSPFSLVSSLGNMASHHVSVMAGTLGPINTVVSACATGTQAIGEAAEVLRRGRADMMIAGGVEGIIHESAIAGFSAMRGLCITHNNNPTQASRPFTKNRNGFVMSEGVGVVILEKLEDALARGAEVHAEILGHASSSDSYHVAILDPEGAGAARAMRWALDDAGLEPSQIGYINAHGSSTPANDLMETVAIKSLFGEHAYDTPISSTKALTGHALGGAGALEAIYTMMALKEGVLPPTWNYDVPDPECDLDYIPNAPRPSEIQYALSNSFGLGGQNACLVLGRYHNGNGA